MNSTQVEKQPTSMVVFCGGLQVDVMERFLLDGQHSDRLMFRKIQTSDYDPWLTFFKDPSSFSFWKGPMADPETECRQWFLRQASRYTLGLGGMNAIVDKSENALVGFAGLLLQDVDDRKELEVAYSIIPSFRKKGYATEAARYCRDFAFRNDLSKTLISIISLTNVLSQQVANRNGMVVEKKIVYHDNEVNIYRINKSDWEKANLY